jgi:hypothetical protein
MSIKLKRSFFIFAQFAYAFSFLAPVGAQVLPDLPKPTKGETINMSVQSGTRSQLSFGSSTSFGSGVSLNATEGTSANATSSLAPSAGASLTLSIGAGTVPSVTTAKVENLKATSATNSSSSGNADLNGVQGKLDLTLDSTRTSFSASTTTLHSSYSPSGQNGAPLKTGNQTSSANGNASVTNNTNVDINTSNFTSIFSQAF